MSNNNKIKVFLVDDDVLFLKSLKHTLDGQEADIKTFLTGEECLRNMEKEKPEVVVVDYCLNGKTGTAMNGIQVMNKIKQSNPATEVIMLSAQDNLSVAIDTLKYGAYDYIPKGQSAFVKVKNDLKHISDSLEKTDDFNDKMDRVKVINVAIIVVFIIIYILNRVL